MTDERSQRIERENAILNAGYVRRWHTSRTFNQNIAEHSWRMAALAIVRYPNISVELLKAIILHDIGEYRFADIPSPIKREHPELRKLEEEIQLDFYKELGITPPKLTVVEEKILKMLDMYEAFCFVQQYDPEAEARRISKRLEYYMKELSAQMPEMEGVE